MMESTITTGAEAERVTKEKLIGELKTLVADAEELLKATASQAGEKITVIRAKAAESVQVAKDRILKEEAALVAKAGSAAKATDQFVHSHPWQSVGVGAFVGFVLGILATRR